MKTSPFNDLRIELAEAFYQASDCKVSCCTSTVCCISLCKLMPRVGLTYSDVSDDFSSQYVHSLPTLVSAEEESVLAVIGTLVRTGNISSRNIWSGFSEIPMSIGELLSANHDHWANELSELRYSQMSNAERIQIQKRFLAELITLAFNDKYFEFLKSKEG